MNTLCNFCSSTLVEKPLFTSVYMACPECDTVKRQEEPTIKIDEVGKRWSSRDPNPQTISRSAIVFNRDPDGLQQCRMVKGLACHFWHGEVGKRAIDCECGTFTRPLGAKKPFLKVIA